MTNKGIPYEIPYNATIKIVRLEKGATLPFRAYSKSVAFDIAAYLPRKTLTIAPSSTVMVPTGLAVHPPLGHSIFVCSRSGLAMKSVFVANAPGVIDPDYTGELKILLFNGGMVAHYVRHNDRVAQFVCLPVFSPPLREVAGLPQTERGEKGFGSSGI